MESVENNRDALHYLLENWYQGGELLAMVCPGHIEVELIGLGLVDRESIDHHLLLHHTWYFLFVAVLDRFPHLLLSFTRWWRRFGRRGGNCGAFLKPLATRACVCAWLSRIMEKEMVH
jgi:hypothetical protein